MNMDATFVLPGDVLVFPASDLEPEMRTQAAARMEDFVITRPNARQPSSIVDESGAVLVQSFREARSIVDAVIDFSRDRSLDPERVLEEAFPMLHNLVSGGILLPADSEQAQRIQPTLRQGQQVAGWAIEATIHIVDDTEVYRVNRGSQQAALKIARPGHEALLAPALRHEAAVLVHLDGAPAPRLLESGDLGGRPFLIVEWCDGEPAVPVARRMRTGTDYAATSRVLQLCVAIVRTYARLHARGVVHGDIHPNNLLVTANGEVRILDFGRARIPGDPSPLDSPPRGGAAFYYDPEQASAMLTGSAPPPADALSEQYCIAVLLREMLVGRPYLDFSLERDQMLRQIVEDRQVPFVRHGALPLPHVERVLGRALSKAPAERFASLGEFADALSQAGEPLAAPPPTNRTASALLDEMLSRVGKAGSALEEFTHGSPLCSVNMGAAGIAYALYRIASIGEDAELLALAELWIDQAERHAVRADAFYCEQFDLSEQTVGRVSLFHTAAGLSCVEALIAIALGDGARATRAVERFVARSTGDCENLDITLGRSGSLLGCATLLAALPMEAAGARDAVRLLGNDLDGAILRNLAGTPMVCPAGSLNLGVAHGWGGVLFALLRWREIAGRRGDDSTLHTWLRDLVALGEDAGEGLRWPWLAGGTDATRFMAGWCNGSAGMAHVMTLAERQLGDSAFGEVARRAALDAREEPSGIGDLCCGAAGRAYAMLNLYRHTGDGQWVDEARRLSEQATTLIGQRAMRRDSLYKGDVGVALLAADLDHPELSCMPLFDREP